MDGIVRYVGRMTDERFPFRTILTTEWPDRSLTSDEWHQAMLKHLDAWLHTPKLDDRKDLLKHMCMTSDEFIHWRETGTVPNNTRIFFTVWSEELQA